MRSVSLRRLGLAVSCICLPIGLCIVSQFSNLVSPVSRTDIQRNSVHQSLRTPGIALLRRPGGADTRVAQFATRHRDCQECFPLLLLASRLGLTITLGPSLSLSRLCEPFRISAVCAQRSVCRRASSTFGNRRICLTE